MIVVVHNRTAEFYQSKQVCIHVNCVMEFFLKSTNLNVACKKLYVSELFDFSHFFLKAKILSLF